MTGKEISELASEAKTIIGKIASEFEKRIDELYVIAQEKGHRCEFGWLEGEVEDPDMDDFETEEEYEEACDKYETFKENRIVFIWMNDHNFIPFEGYSFEIDESGYVTFTSVINVDDQEDPVWVDDESFDFDPSLASNWRICEIILKKIELELEIE